MMNLKIILFVIVLIPSFSSYAFAEDVPDWVRTSINWWSEGKISESEFLNAMEYLIESGIISIESQNQEKLLQDAAMLENWLNIKFFTSFLLSHGDLVSLLADTAEFQTLMKLSEYDTFDDSIFDSKFVKDNVLERFIEFAKIDSNIDQLKILDKSGIEIFRINNVNGTLTQVLDDKLQDKSDRYYFYEALQLEVDDVYISHIDLTKEHGEIIIPYKPTLRFITPIHDINKEIMGYLIVNYLMEQILSEFTQSQFCDTTIFDEHGTIVLDSNSTELFGDQVGTNINYYSLHPKFLKADKENQNHYYDEVHQNRLIIDRTDKHGSMSYWHFVCEVK